MEQMSQTLSELQSSLPKISSTLPWDKPKFFRSRKFKQLKMKMGRRSRIDKPYANGSKSENTRNSIQNEYDGMSY